MDNGRRPIDLPRPVHWLAVALVTLSLVAVCVLLWILVIAVGKALL